MNKSTIILKVILLIVLFVGSEAVPKSTDVSEIQIMSKNKELKVGEPLIVELFVNLTSPHIQPDSNKPYHNWIQGGFFKLSIFGEDPNSSVMLKAFPLSLPILDTEGLKYGASFTLFYDHGVKKLLFDKPGTYLIQFILSKTNSSNTIEVSVKEPTQRLKNAILLLSDPNDYFFLEFASHDDKSKRQERISHLQQVTEQFNDTLLAKMSAARLGLEYFQEFHKKHPSFEKFKAKHQQGQIEEPLFDQARKYLAAGARLADEFPIREKILYQLTRTEAIRGNYEKAFSLLDELRAKYPKGKYGKRSSSAKAELIELQKRELAQAPQPQVSGWSRLLPLFLVIAVGIVLIGLILLLRKKASSRGKSRAT